MGQAIVVKIGEVKFAGENGVLVTYALGSCVGVCMVDTVRRLGAMAHVLLPHYTGTGESDDKYADVAVRNMYDGMLALGATRKNIEVKLCGGARMFPVGMSDERFSIGERNIEAVLSEIEKLGLRVSENQLGGVTARTMYLNVNTGEMTVTTRAVGADSRRSSAKQLSARNHRNYP